MRGSTAARLVHWTLTLGIICVSAGAARAEVIKFREAIPFYSGQLVGYEKAAELRIGSRVFRPLEAGRLFVTIKLEIRAPFAYRRGMFRELTLIDENGRVYQYNGLLMEQGWHAIDEATGGKPGDVVMTFSADAYPKQLDVHFEIPVVANRLTLRHGDRTHVLFSPPK